jgi:hypothetical protein
MAMRYHWGHGVGHTYSHNFWKMQGASSDDPQGDVEMGVMEEISPQARRNTPSNLGSNVANHTNEENDGEGEEDNGTASGDDDGDLEDKNYDEYDDDDDNYNYDEDDDADEDEEEEEEEDMSDDSE